MNIGTIGSGNIGAALTRHLTNRGHAVLIATREDRKAWLHSHRKPTRNR